MKLFPIILCPSVERHMSALELLCLEEQGMILTEEEQHIVNAYLNSLEDG